MRKILMATPLLLGGLTALPAAAQTTIWTGPSLIVNGTNISGCNSIQVQEASHTGTANNGISVSLFNAGPNRLRVFAHVVLTGPTGTKVNTEFSAGMFPGVGAMTSRAGTPFAGSLAGTRLTVNLTNCVVQ